MNSAMYIVGEFGNSKKEEWDRFVLEESLNGTFLQTRRFLDYHPEGKFVDASIMIYDNKKNLVAVSPACELYENDLKIFYSHKGSTFGGIIVSKKIQSVIKVIEVIESIEEYLKTKKIQQIYYKLTPEIFSRESVNELEYALFYKKYLEYKEINLVALLDNYGDNVLSKLKQGKRTNITNCIKSGIKIRNLEKKSEIIEFYNILKETLKKYDLQPIHSIDELVEFKEYRLREECEFFGAFLDNKMVAGAMVFYFHQARCAHTQYLCARHEYDKLSPMSYMYYSMIIEMKLRQYKTLSWGITSEHFGNILNIGLTKSKEAFGSKVSINRIFFKQLI